MLPVEPSPELAAQGREAVENGKRNWDDRIDIGILDYSSPEMGVTRRIDLNRASNQQTDDQSRTDRESGALRGDVPRQSTGSSSVPDESVDGRLNLTEAEVDSALQNLGGNTVEPRKEKYNPDLQDLFGPNQLALDFRKGTTDEERRNAAILQNTAPKLCLRRPGYSILANAISTEFRNRGVFNFIGQEVRSAFDLAAIAQVYRNPSFETLRYFFTKNGVIVEHKRRASPLLQGMCNTGPE